MQSEGVRIATAVETDALRDDLAERLVSGLLEQIGGPPDLCFMFASAHFEDRLERLTPQIAGLVKPRAFLGATVEGVIAHDIEHEHGPAVALWGARLPGASVSTFHLTNDDLKRLNTPDELRDYLNVPADAEPTFFVLADPYSGGAAAMRFLEQVSIVFGPRPVIGGMASSADEPGQNRLIFDGHVMHSGIVGAAVWGDVVVAPIVSQGCRPVGRRMQVTKSEHNIIHELGGKPPADVLNEVLNELAPDDLELVRSVGPLIGRLVPAAEQSVSVDDASSFVVRNPLGLDEHGLSVNDLMPAGAVIQFCVRDAASADQNLAQALAEGVPRGSAGALLFSCSGRGSRLFAYRHHDARAVADHTRTAGVAGAFLAGEFGPIGERNFLHGFTASIAVFR